MRSAFLRRMGLCGKTGQSLTFMIVEALLYDDTLLAFKPELAVCAASKANPTAKDNDVGHNAVTPCRQDVTQLHDSSD